MLSRDITQWDCSNSGVKSAGEPAAGGEGRKLLTERGLQVRKEGGRRDREGRREREREREGVGGRREEGERERGSGGGGGG